MYIKVLPIKVLCEKTENITEKVAAVITSSYEVDVCKLEAIEYKIIFDFADTKEKNHPQSFRRLHAEKIKEFLENLPNDIEKLYVCCDSGESRSTAMAAAITRYLNGDEMKIWKNPKYHPNPLVFCVLTRVLGVGVTHVELKYREWLNQQALKNAIKNS